MVESDRQELLQELNKGREALREALAGVDEQLAVRKPGPDRWSVLECVEHLAVVEQFLYSKLVKASRADGSLENRRREAKILERAPDRTRRVESPEAGRPHSRFHNLDEALSSFDSARAETIRYVEGFADDPRCWVTDHPVITGPVNCYEMLLMISLHPMRHAKQIAEIRSAVSSAQAQ